MLCEIKLSSMNRTESVILELTPTQIDFFRDIRDLANEESDWYCTPTMSVKAFEEDNPDG